MRYRSRTEIVSQILEIANGRSSSTNDGNYSITKTRIMYGVSLSYGQLKEYLEMLTDNGLLSYDLDTRTFKTTEKGQRFLQIYNQVGNVLKEQV